ncbi:MAG: flavodoxin family protein [Methanomassiliicoccales archaeon]|nr:flavodoxin family protein [Methanomassiliicoccales archaeon]
MTLIVGILGSPRRKGNSDLLLDRALKAASDAGAEVRKVVLNELKLRPCQGCNDCHEDGECVQRDDLTLVYELLEQADAVIIASPIYFSGPSAQTKILIDRCQCLWVRNEKLDRYANAKRRRGAFIAVGGDEKAVFRHAVGEIRAFYSAIGLSYDGEILLPGVEGKGEVLSHPDTLAQAEALGRRLATSEPS